ncbi:2071_t:CDS:1, partial [Acaulospora colombiana]
DAVVDVEEAEEIREDGVAAHSAQGDVVKADLRMGLFQFDATMAHSSRRDSKVFEFTMR